MRAVPENVRTVQETGTQFQIPSFLLAEPGVRRFDEEGIGTGLIWVGLALIALPVVTSNLSPLALGAWLVGCFLTGYGILRTRRDGQSMLRAGALTAAAGLLTLGMLANSILRHEQAPAELDPELATQSLTSSSQAGELDDSLASVLTGSNPMFRGAPAHTGVLAGPGLDGNPYRSWRYDAGEDLRSTPAISGAVAYFGTRDGYLIALDLLTHQQKWDFDLSGFPVRSSPAIANRTVFISSGFTLYAIDADNGRELWNVDMAYAGESSPTVADGVVYVASKENNLYAFDTESGEQLWFFKTDGLLFGTPSLTDEAVIIGGDDGDLFAVDRENGHLHWKITLDSAIYSTPAISDGRIFVTTKGQTISAVDLESGELIWSYPVGGSSSPAVADGVVFVGSDDGALYAIDAEVGGEPLWLFATGSQRVQSPVVVGDEVILAAGAMVVSLDRASGEVVWQYPVGNDVTTGTVILDGYLYAGDKDGYLYAIAGDSDLSTPEEGAEGASGGKAGAT
jgi:outer membrane protein assembly factor BamB